MLWRDVLKTGTYRGTGIEPIDKDDLIEAYLKQVPLDDSWTNWLFGSAGISVAKLGTLAVEHWGASDRRIFDRLHFRAIADVATVELADRIYKTDEQTGDEAHVDVYVGLDKANTIFGTTGNDLIFGGNHDDTLYTRGGKDVIDAPAGSNSIIDTLGSSPVGGRIVR